MAELASQLWSPPNLLFSEYKGTLSAEVNQPAHEPDSPSSIEVKNERRCTATSPNAFVECTGTHLL
jgi:hypothetical protein